MPAPVKHAPGRKPAAPPVLDHAVLREKWPQWLKDAFNAYGPAAVWIGGARDLISATVHHADGTQTRFGHNRLSRPVKVGLSESWRDTVTQRLNQVPFWWQGLIARVWVPSDAHARQLMLGVVDHLSALGELTVCRGDFIDIGPDIAVEDLETVLLRLAHEQGIEAWDDDGLVAHLARLDRQRKEHQAKRGGRRH